MALLARLLDAPQLLALAAALGWASGLMVAIEFMANKVALVDSLWDAVHTVVRIPAGAALAAATLGAEGPAVNTSPEPFSNIGVSLVEDGFVVFMLWLALVQPVWFAVALVLTPVVAVVLIVVLFRFLRAVVRRFADSTAGVRPLPRKLDV